MKVSTFLLRPLTAGFFIVMLAGRFSLDRVVGENPFFVPERLVAFVILTFLVGVVGLANTRSDRSQRRTGLFVAVPLVYFLATALWGADVPDYWATVTDIVCMLLACMIVSILLQWNTVMVAETFLWCLTVAGVVFSVAGLASASAGTQVSAFGGGPNVFSRITVLGFIALVGLIAMQKIPIAGLAAGPLMLVATIVSGSRGGMLAGLVSMGVLAPLTRRLKLFHILVGLGLLIACMVAVSQKYSDSIEKVIDGRIVELTLQQGYTSGRGDLYLSAWNLFLNNILMGSGLRGFAEHYGQGFSYPHNLFLHAASEGGIGALILLLVVFVWFARRVLHRPHSPLTLVYIAAASAIFTSAMFSGDYYDNRFLWVFMIIAIRVTEVPEGATDSMTTTSRANEHMTTDRRPQ